jgi:ABC-type multidrug transport system fused ATPase/permease subunit
MLLIRDHGVEDYIKSAVVAENGPHQQLLTLNGVYAELHRLQYGDHT